jgi:hypothetical protein
VWVLKEAGEEDSVAVGCRWVVVEPEGVVWILVNAEEY